MIELYRGPWGPPRTDPAPRTLNDDGDLAFLYEHCADLVGTELVVANFPDPSTGGVRYAAVWSDEDGRSIGRVGGDARLVGDAISHFAEVGRRTFGVAIDLPPALEA